jgi:hypothetical protein
MATLNFETTVNVSKDKAWNLLADFAGVSIFHPTVPKSYAINGTGDTGLGAERRCELSNNGSKYVEERIIRFVDGHEFDVEIFGGNQIPPVNNFIETLGVEAIGTNQTRVYMKVNYQPKWGPIGFIMNIMMIKPLLTKVLNGILVGFKLHVETGQPVQSFRTLQVAGLFA